eukprot:8351655-Alexandrium_andersonii.AAC.1
MWTPELQTCGELRVGADALRRVVELRIRLQLRLWIATLRWPRAPASGGGAGAEMGGPARTL